MDALTEQTCSECHGTGGVGMPGDCSICNGTGAIPKQWMHKTPGPVPALPPQNNVVRAERERIAAWLEAKSAEVDSSEVAYHLELVAQAIRNGNYERMLELRDLLGT